MEKKTLQGKRYESQHQHFLFPICFVLTSVSLCCSLNTSYQIGTRVKVLRVYLLALQL